MTNPIDEEVYGNASREKAVVKNGNPGVPQSDFEEAAVQADLEPRDTAPERPGLERGAP
jgi:hypothetical protein